MFNDATTYNKEGVDDDSAPVGNSEAISTSVPIQRADDHQELAQDQGHQTRLLIYWWAMPTDVDASTLRHGRKGDKVII